MSATWVPLPTPIPVSEVGEAAHLLPRSGEGEALAPLEVVQELVLAEALRRGVEQRAHGLGEGAPFHLGVPGADLFRSSHDSPVRHDLSKGRECFHPRIAGASGAAMRPSGW